MPVVLSKPAQEAGVGVQEVDRWLLVVWTSSHGRYTRGLPEFLEAELQNQVKFYSRPIIRDVSGGEMTPDLVEEILAYMRRLESKDVRSVHVVIYGKCTDGL